MIWTWIKSIFAPGSFPPGYGFFKKISRQYSYGYQDCSNMSADYWAYLHYHKLAADSAVFYGRNGDKAHAWVEFTDKKGNQWCADPAKKRCGKYSLTDNYNTVYRVDDEKLLTDYWNGNYRGNYFNRENNRIVKR